MSKCDEGDVTFVYKHNSVCKSREMVLDELLGKNQVPVQRPKILSNGERIFLLKGLKFGKTNQKFWIDKNAFISIARGWKVLELVERDDDIEGTTVYTLIPKERHGFSRWSNKLPSRSSRSSRSPSRSFKSRPPPKSPRSSFKFSSRSPSPPKSSSRSPSPSKSPRSPSKSYRSPSRTPLPENIQYPPLHLYIPIPKQPTTRRAPTSSPRKQSSTTRKSPRKQSPTKLTPTPKRATSIKTPDPTTKQSPFPQSRSETASWRNSEWKTAKRKE